MAKLYITEYIGAQVGALGNAVQIANTPGGKDQTPVAIGAGHLESAPFAITTTMIRVHTDAICSIAFTPANASAVVAATINNLRLPADATEYFGVNPGDTLSVIANT